MQLLDYNSRLLALGVLLCAINIRLRDAAGDLATRRKNGEEVSLVWNGVGE